MTNHERGGQEKPGTLHLEALAHDLEACLDRNGQEAPYKVGSMLFWAANYPDDRTKSDVPLSEDMRVVVTESVLNIYRRSLSDSAGAEFARYANELLSKASKELGEEYLSLKVLTDEQRESLAAALESQFGGEWPTPTENLDSEMSDLLDHKLPIAPTGNEDFRVEPEAQSPEEVSDDRLREIRRGWIAQYAVMSPEAIKQMRIQNDHLDLTTDFTNEEIEHYRLYLIQSFLDLSLEEVRIRNEVFRQNQNPTGE